jgi:aconitate hydratase
MTVKCDQAEALQNERVLALLGDFITTDHISPAGAIALDSPAANYLQDMDQAPADFNTYGSRRGNHEVMMRGTFANVKLQNQMACGKRGGYTKDVLTGQVTTIFEAAEHYKQEGVGAIVVAGKMYGSGSSRDWAAKGPNLLGVRAVIAESFERIHRSNLIGMGILPLQFEEGQTAADLGICGDEVFSVAPIDFSAGLPEPGIVDVEFKRADGTMGNFKAVVRIDTPTEGQYFANGGILQFVLRDLL